MNSKTVKARIKTYNGGKFGKSGEYVAIIIPKYFKNGNLKKSDFEVVEVLEIIKKDYGYKTATHSETIAEILN